MLTDSQAAEFESLSSSLQVQDVEKCVIVPGKDCSVVECLLPGAFRLKRCLSSTAVPGRQTHDVR